MHDFERWLTAPSRRPEWCSSCRRSSFSMPESRQHVRRV